MYVIHIYRQTYLFRNKVRTKHLSLSRRLQRQSKKQSPLPLKSQRSSPMGQTPRDMPAGRVVVWVPVVPAYWALHARLLVYITHRW